MRRPARIPLSLEEWIEAQRAATDPDPDVLAIVRSVIRVCRIGMFTNNPLLLKQTFAQVFPEAAILFGERAVFSAELGRRKPDPEAFRLMAARLETSPASIFYVDDDADYVDGARQAGLHAQVFAGHALLRHQLRASSRACSCGSL